jgi:hypothetical protein
MDGKEVMANHEEEDSFLNTSCQTVEELCPQGKGCD